MNLVAIDRRQLLLILILLLLLFTLPLAVYLVRTRQDIRPRALEGQANLLLNTDNSSPQAGDKFIVSVSLQLTEPSLRVSGANFMLLYDKAKLEALSVDPSASTDDPNAPFTEVVIKEKEKDFDGTFSYLRLSQVANKNTEDLHGGIVALATISFKTKQKGEAQIKFPEDNSYLEIVGISVDEQEPTVTSSPTVIPTLTPTVAPTSTISPTVIPTPTTTPTPSLTPTPTVEPCCIGEEEELDRCIYITGESLCKQADDCRWVCDEDD